MKKRIIILVLISALLTTGCWNYRELNEMAIVGAIGIDYDDKTDEFDVSVQVFNAKKISSGTTTGGGDTSPVTVYQSKAKTIHEAIRNVVYDSPKNLYIGHLEALVIGENLAKEHLVDGIDFLFRDSESRKDFDIAITRGIKPIEILKVLTPLENIPSTSLMQTMKVNSIFKGAAISITYDKFLSYMYTEGIEGVLTAISVKGNANKGDDTENTSTSIPKADLKIEGLAAFKGTKLIGYLTPLDSIGYSFISNEMKSTVLSFECDDSGSTAAIELIKSKSKLNVKLENNVPKATIQIKAEASLSECNCNIELKIPKNINKLKEKAAQKIKETIEGTIKTAQKTLNSDFLGFGEFLYHNNYKYWMKNREKWYEIFPNIDYEVKVDLKMESKGSIIKSSKEVLNGKAK